MKKETFDSLKLQYPILFSQVDGIYCGDGWINLIKQLCHVIDQEMISIPEEVHQEIYASQIKQKFGGLRWYMNQSTPFINGAIRMAEQQSCFICEACGNTGKLVNKNGWFFVACPIHEK